MSGRGDSVGNKTECALLSYVGSCLGYNYEQLRSSNPESSFRKLYTFNSQRKYMATVVPRHQTTTTPPSTTTTLPQTTTTPSESTSEHAYRLFVKGAADVILARSVTE